jgi:hypothetical protein
MATAKARIDRIDSGIDARLEIRKELARSVPELGSERELDELLAAILRSVENAAAGPLQDVPAGAVRNALKARTDQDLNRLKAGAKTKIEILKREFALRLHEQQEPRSVSVTTGGGPALVNLGTIYGGVRQVIGNVSEAGYRELADLLQRLAQAIGDAETLGDERAAYLQQVQFIAKQAAEPADVRQSSVVKGLLAGLRARLEDGAHLSGVLALVGPAIARHFGFPWPF